MVAGDGSPSAGSTGVAWKQLLEHAWIFALDQVVVCMVTTRPPKTIVEPTALGPVANTDTKSLIYDLFQKGRVLAQDGVPPVRGPALKGLQRKLGGNWRTVEQHHLEREFRFKDFREALAFTNRVGELAETQGHHPDIHLAWGMVRLTIWTHKIDGLTESDFILAAKVDELSAAANT